MKPAQRRGLLIVFEGTDGTGKSTQIDLLNRHLLENHFETIITREPTDGQYGKKIRQLYSSRNNYGKEEELQLFLKDRHEHVNQLLEPGLVEGKIILCDRYFLSTAAYQGAIGFDPEEILRRNSFAPDPDIAFLFQMPLEQALARIVNSRGDTLNDFEQLENLKNVSDIYNAIKRDYITPIDASGSMEVVFKQILDTISPLLKKFTKNRT